MSRMNGKKTHTYTHTTTAVPEITLFDSMDKGVSFYLFIIMYSKSMVQPGKVANPACGQLKRENEYFPVRVRA